MASDLKSMLLEAIALGPGERESYLAQCAKSDEEIALRLRSLICAWDDASTLLRDPSATTVTRSAAGAAEAAGDRVGVFVLEDRLGEGGFGVVWRARQELPVRRTVAVKILKPGMERSDFLARFEHERQALARLTHPSIARIYDAGVTERGRPYFAMELVEGAPITDHCETRRLNLRERLSLFRDVCLAVHHAHTKGVIHRDLKPSNILVSEADDKATPKVIDFGVAKATDEPLSDLTLVTLARQIVGTPRYMSPEQASLDSTSVDTRSDVYSLGVVLYELLCAQPLIADDVLNRLGLAELHNALLTARRERPSARLRASATLRAQRSERLHTDEASMMSALSADLDWIALRATAPDPAERYASAAALAADIDRWLRGDPVVAHPPSTMYQLRKFARRHKPLVISATASALLLVAGVVGTGVGLVRAMNAERIASAERDAAETALAQANAVSEFLETMISSVDPLQRGRDVRVVDLLDDAAATVDAQFAGQDAVRARVLGSLAAAYWSLGELQTARGLFERALEIRTHLYGAEHDLTLRTLANIASLRYQIGDVQGALEATESLLEVYGATLGERSERYVDLLSNYAVFLSVNDQSDDALAAQQRVVDLQREIRGPTHERTIGAMVNLGSLLRDRQDVEGARQVVEEALDLALESLGPDHPTTLLLRGNLAIAYERGGDLEGAIDQYQDVIAAQRRVHGERHQSTLLTMRNLSSLLLVSGRYEEGFALVREALSAIPDPIPYSHRMALSVPSMFLGHLQNDPSWALPEDVAIAVMAIIRNNLENESLSVVTRDHFVQLLAMINPPELRDPSLAVELARTNEAVSRAQGLPDAWTFVETVAFSLARAGRHDEAVQEQRRAIAEADEVGLIGPDREAMDERLREYLVAIDGE